MSYCRWSCDDFQCDVYVYEHCHGGWVIHIADLRRTPPAETRPAPLDPPDWWAHGKAAADAFMRRRDAVRDWLATAPSLPIGLPHDGETISTETPAECADELERLRSVGYNVPEHAIDELRAEALAGATDAPQ